jgi:hypothetical protein
LKVVPLNVCERTTKSSTYVLLDEFCGSNPEAADVFVAARARLAPMDFPLDSDQKSLVFGMAQ